MKDISLHDDGLLPLRDVVFNVLRNAILTGDLEPGERLKEINLAEKLGVSRTPIREAIRKLELEGLVVMTPGKSTEVARITKEDLTDVLEVRRVLECLAVELSCANMTEELLGSLEKNMAKFRGAVKKNDIKEIASADVEFHELIYRSTGNRRLIQILNNLREQMYRYRLEYIKDEVTRENLVTDHRNIMNALASGDVEEGKKAILSHIDKQESTILENIRNEG